MSKPIYDLKLVKELPTANISNEYVYLLTEIDGQKPANTFWLYDNATDVWTSVFPISINTNTITEATANSGVTVEGVLLKDSAISVDHIEEKTSNHGVVIDGVTLKDKNVLSDVINEATSNAGVTVESVTLKDGEILVDQIKEKTIDRGVTIEGVILKDLVVTSIGGFVTTTGTAGIIPFAKENAITTNGTPQQVTTNNYHTKLTSTGTGDAIGIPITGASAGQLKKISYVAEGAGGDTVVLTPSVTTGFASCTFNTVNNYVILMFNGTYWDVIENSGCTLT